MVKNDLPPDHKLISICSGALSAARAGLLDEYPALPTTSVTMSFVRSPRGPEFSKIVSMSKTVSATQAPGLRQELI